MSEHIPRYGATVDAGPLKVSASLDIGPITRHISAFLQLRCAPDLLELGVFPRNSVSKEITESMAAFAAVRDWLGGHELFGDSSVGMFDVGSGTAPRTGALFAYRTRWECASIDPALRPSWEGRIERLRIIPERVEEVSASVDGLAVITLVHAHCSVVAALRAITAERYLVVAIPCCVPHELPVEPNREYADYGCWSPQRKVKVWDLTWPQRDALVRRREISA